MFRYFKTCFTGCMAKNPIKNYNFIKRIGYGATAEVYEIQHKKDKKSYICKKFPHSKHELSLREMHVIKRFNDPHLPKFKNYIHLNGVSYLLMEYMPGSDLFDVFITERKRSYNQEEELHGVAMGIVTCMKAYFRYNVQHLDIKLENLIYTEEKPAIRIIDFGSAHYAYDNNMHSLGCPVGTCGYIAPEIKNRLYHRNTDIWSFGVCLWILHTGYNPFRQDSENYDSYGDPRAHQGENKSNPSDDFPNREDTHFLSSMSSNLHDLFLKIFVKDPKKRISLEELEKHEWMRSF